MPAGITERAKELKMDCSKEKIDKLIDNHTSGYRDANGNIIAKIDMTAVMGDMILMLDKMFDSPAKNKEPSGTSDNRPKA